VRIGIDLACWANNRGYGRYTRNLVGALVAGDTSHDYVGFADPATLRAGGLPAGLDIVPVAVSEAPTEAAAHDGRRRLVDLWRMTRAAQRATVDVMFFPSSYTYFPVLGPTRTVIVVHDAIAERLPRLIFPNRAGRLAWTLKTRLACWQAQRVVTVSHAAAHSIQHYLPIAPERVRVIYEAADPIFTPPPQGEMNPERRAAVLARFGIRPDARVILYVGGFGPHKNVSTLIDAFARLDNALAMPLQLVLVGQSEGEVFHSEVGALRQQVRRDRLEDRVTFTGFVPDGELVEWYQAATCLVLPSHDEGFGLPVVEAMACGTPVVASRVGAIPELIGEDAGLLFTADRSDELVTALRRLLTGDGALSRAFRAAGLRRAAALSWPRAAAALVDIFDELEPERGVSTRAA